MTGKITNQGQSVAPGTIVTFVAGSGGVGTGIVEEEGVYRIKTPEGDALPVGEYQVFLGPPPPAPVDPAALRAEKEASATGGMKVEATVWNVPEKYQKAATSEWTASVKEGENTFDFAI